MSAVRPIYTRAAAKKSNAGRLDLGLFRPIDDFLLPIFPGSIAQTKVGQDFSEALVIGVHVRPLVDL